MDRQHLKFISALLAVLMFIAPIASLAMQPGMPGSHSGHCQGMETDSERSPHGLSVHASCAMASCVEGCSASQNCSSQAPIILARLDMQRYPGGQGIAIDRIPATHLFVHLSGPYRPPRP